MAVDGWEAPLTLHAKAWGRIKTLICWRIGAPGHLTGQATVELRELKERFTLASFYHFSLQIYMGQLWRPRGRVFHIGGLFVFDVEAGVDLGLLLERSHASPGVEVVLAITAVKLVH